MSSMSYCLFENTDSELTRCVNKMADARSLEDLDFNEYELRAFHTMWRTCRDFLAEHERLLTAENQRAYEEHNAAFNAAIDGA